MMQVAQPVRVVHVAACPDCGGPQQEFEGEAFCALCTRFALTPEPSPASSEYPTPAQKAAFQAFHASQGRRDVRLLVGVLNLALELAERFLGEHPDGCGCDFCAFDEDSGYLREDVQGLRWPLEIAASHLSADTGPHADHDSDKPAGDLLRELTAFADAGCPDAR